MSVEKLTQWFVGRKVGDWNWEELEEGVNVVKTHYIKFFKNLKKKNLKYFIKTKWKISLFSKMSFHSLSNIVIHILLISSNYFLLLGIKRGALLSDLFLYYISRYLLMLNCGLFWSRNISFNDFFYFMMVWKINLYWKLFSLFTFCSFCMWEVVVQYLILMLNNIYQTCYQKSKPKQIIYSPLYG